MISIHSLLDERSGGRLRSVSARHNSALVLHFKGHALKRFYRLRVHRGDDQRHLTACASAYRVVCTSRTRRARARRVRACDGRVLEGM